MRKLFFLFVFVLGTGMSLNANTLIKNVKLENSAIESVNVIFQQQLTCFEMADSLAMAFGILNGWTYEQEHEAFLSVYDACVATGAAGPE